MSSGRRAGRPAPWGVWAVGLATAALAAGWLYFLSGWMFVVPGSELVQRRDVLFQSDTGWWVTTYGARYEAVGSFTHPLLGMWRLGPHGLYLLLVHVMPDQEARLVAGRSFNGAIAGTGVGFLFAAAFHRGLPLRTLGILLPVYLLFTSQILACLPEHFGMSSGLLSISFAVVLCSLRRWTKLALLALLAIAAGGVTISNALFPLAASAWVVRQEVDRRSWRRLVAGAGAAGIVGLAAFVALLMADHGKMERLYWRVAPWVTARPVRDPAGAAKLALRGLIDPVIGATPVIDRNNDWHLPMVTYQPTYAAYRLWPYDPLQTASAVAWSLLLAVCVERGWTNAATRPWVGLLLFWILFNTVLHLCWGDEYFLFSSHWSWALLALVLLGVERVRWPYVAVAGAVLAAGQIHTLLEIHAALSTIV